MRISATAEQLDYLNSLGVPVAATTTRGSSSITVRQPRQPRRVGSASRAGAAKRKWSPALIVACVAGVLVLVVVLLIAGLAVRSKTFNVIRPHQAVEERRMNVLKMAGPAAKKVDVPQQDRQAVLEQVER